MTEQRPLSRAHQALGLLGWVGLCYGAAAIGAVASANAGTFYAELVRPSWAPPGWLFGPVWTVLYTMMGVAAWWIWRVRGRSGVSGALAIFVAQLAVNALWSWLFFAWRLGGAAFAEIVVLWVLIVGTIVAFGRIRRAAAWLLVPYLLWVTFATALNYALWMRNPGLLR